MTLATHAVLLTPPGRGAVATIAVAGPLAVQAVTSRLHLRGGESFAGRPIGAIVFGRWESSQGEELVAVRRDCDEVEVHCHGGDAASAAILQSLSDAGCEVVPWQTWLGQRDAASLRADALRALSQARTERAARVLLDQYQGALAQACGELRSFITTGDLRSAEALIERLLENAQFGLRLTRPWSIVLAGPPNVGKSSLINALVGFERSIVFDTPGTTRDIVTATTAFDGWPVELADTAGLRQSPDALEAAGVQLAQDRLAVADLVVLVSDTSQPWTAAEAEILATRPEAICVHNKCDLPPATSNRPPGVATSAVTGQGLSLLIEAIVQRFGRPPEPGAAVPFTDEQVDLLRVVQQAILAGDLATATTTLDKLNPNPKS